MIHIFCLICYIIIIIPLFWAPFGGSGDKFYRYLLGSGEGRQHKRTTLRPQEDTRERTNIDFKDGWLEKGVHVAVIVVLVSVIVFFLMSMCEIHFGSPLMPDGLRNHGFLGVSRVRET